MQSLPHVSLGDTGFITHCSLAFNVDNAHTVVQNSSISVVNC
jgi:hypothetical protein